MTLDFHAQLTERLTHATLADVGIEVSAAIENHAQPQFDPIELALISLVFADSAMAPDGADVATTGADLVATQILGEGGMGIVYLAQQQTLGREVAVKLARDGDLDPRLHFALIAEARLVGSLEHPNIIPIHAVGRDHRGLPVLVMKRVEGVVWSDLLENPEHAAWSRDELASEDRLAAHLEILMQVANALHYAHTRGVVHRDVKPRNVMVGPFGEVYLLDWGMALRQGTTQHAGFVGTPAYMAPEMLLGDPACIDARTDVYLLGATLHEILTGKHRHAATSLVDALASARMSAPFAYGPGVPIELAELCNAATHPDIGRRPASAAAFRQAVATYLHHRTSIVLTREAQVKLDTLDPPCAVAGSLSELDVAQRLAECRFGFLEALRMWRSNEPARRGLDACLAAMIERELELENVSAARTMLMEMDRPDVTIVGRIDALEARLRVERERAEAAVRFARELDPSVWRGPRAVAMAAMLVGTAVANVLGVAREVRTGVPTPNSHAILVDLGQVAALCLGIGVVGTKVLSNQYNRRFFGIVLIVTLAATVVDSIAWWREVDARTANLIDAVLTTAVFAVGAHNLEPRAWLLVAVWSAAVTFCVVVPAMTNVATTTATLVSIVIAIWIVRRSSLRIPKSI